MQTWPDLISAAACCVLMACLIPIGAVLHPRRRPFHALGLLSICCALYAQIAAPFIGLAPTSWPTAMLHALAALCAVAMRGHLMNFSRQVLACPAQQGEKAG